MVLESMVQPKNVIFIAILALQQQITEEMHP